MNICTGGGPSGDRATKHCRDVGLRAPRGRARNIETFGISCAGARGLVARSPSARYVHTGGRFRYGRFFCGSEGDRALGPPAFFEWARGRVSIFYDVTVSP
jgi:hypothetical protein